MVVPDTSFAALLISGFISMLGDMLSSVFSSIAAALAYLRLRRIKEGGGPAIADVFT